MARKWSEIRKGPPSVVKPLTPEIAESLARLDQFCGELTNSDRDDPTADLLELGHRYTAGEITFEEFQRAYWQTRPVGERLEETWRLSEQALPGPDDSAKNSCQKD